MEVSNNFNRYDSRVQTNTNVNQSRQTSRTGTIKQFLHAFRIEFSQKALNSKELYDPSIKFPTHNPDVLQYSENLNLVYKP